MIRLFIILFAITLGIVRVRRLHRNGVKILQAVGLSFNRSDIFNCMVGLAAGFLAIGVIFLLCLSFQISHIISFGLSNKIFDSLENTFMVSLIEELLFRSALLGGLLVLFPKQRWMCVLYSALIFGMIHGLNQNATVLAVLGSTIGGLYYGIAFAAAKRIWFPMSLHFSWNFALSYIFGFPISGYPPPNSFFVQQYFASPVWLTGGNYGPEGGIIGLAGRAIAVIVVTGWFLNIERIQERKSASQTSYQG